MGNYYILISDYPFENSDLSANMSSPIVESIYVDNPIASGTGIPLNNKSGKFVRIQLDGSGFISFTEIELFGIEPGNGGSGEICDNGEDDDCDGKIDCEDNDCNVIINEVLSSNPSASIYSDGEIAVQAFANEQIYVRYSIDGGSTFRERDENSNSVCTFSGLPEGTYNIVVENNYCVSEYVGNPVILASTTGITTSNCDNGGFETSTFQGWTGRSGKYVNGQITNLEEVLDLSTNIGFALIPSGTFQDNNFLNVSNTNIVTSPTGGTYLARLGDFTSFENNFDSRNDLYQLEYCFEVNQDNADFSFNYALFFVDPNNHNDNQKPFFDWRLIRTSNGQILSSNTVRSNDGSFFESTGNGEALQGWTCQQSDLSQFIGENVCVIITVSECGFEDGTHGAYAYIDAICETPIDNIPDCEFSLSGVCLNQDVQSR